MSQTELPRLVLFSKVHVPVKNIDDLVNGGWNFLVIGEQIQEDLLLNSREEKIQVQLRLAGTEQRSKLLLTESVGRKPQTL